MFPEELWHIHLVPVTMTRSAGGHGGGWRRRDEMIGNSHQGTEQRVRYAENAPGQVNGEVSSTLCQLISPAQTDWNRIQ